MQLFLPEMDPRQDSEPGMYVRVPPGVSPGPQELADYWLGKHRRAMGSRKPRAQQIQPGAKHPHTPFQCGEGNMKDDGLHLRMSPCFQQPFQKYF